jgi:hypothetical protein
MSSLVDASLASGAAMIATENTILRADANVTLLLQGRLEERATMLTIPLAARLFVDSQPNLKRERVFVGISRKGPATIPTLEALSIR